MYGKKKGITRKFTRNLTSLKRMTQKLKPKLNGNITLSLTLGLRNKKGGKRSSSKRSSSGKRSSSKRSSKSKKRYGKSKKKMSGGDSDSIIGLPYNAGDLVPQGNHLPFNPNVIDTPQPSNNMTGGQKRYRKNQRGGGMFSTFFPDEAVNFTRYVPATLGQMYDRFNGATSTASSFVYPTDQPLAAASVATGVAAATAKGLMPPSDLLKMYNNNNNLVSRI
jgi:hypothetical protein